MEAKIEEEKVENKGEVLSPGTEIEETEDIVINEEDLIKIREALEVKHDKIRNELDNKMLSLEKRIELSYDEEHVRKLKNKITALTRGD